MTIKEFSGKSRKLSRYAFLTATFYHTNTNRKYFNRIMLKIYQISVTEARIVSIKGSRTVNRSIPLHVRLEPIHQVPFNCYSNPAIFFSMSTQEKDKIYYLQNSFSNYLFRIFLILILFIP